MSKSILALFFFFAAAALPGWVNNIDNAKQQAKDEHKLILLNFSGSDWCIPCMHMREEVFDADAFTRYAADHLILVNADFPRQKKNQLSKELQKSNDALAEKYNPQGSFPFTVLLDADGNKLKVWDGFFKSGAENFVNEIEAVRSIKETH